MTGRQNAVAELLEPKPEPLPERARLERLHPVRLQLLVALKAAVIDRLETMQREPQSRVEALFYDPTEQVDRPPISVRLE